MQHAAILIALASPASSCQCLLLPSRAALKPIPLRQPLSWPVKAASWASPRAYAAAAETGPTQSRAFDRLRSAAAAWIRAVKMILRRWLHLSAPPAAYRTLPAVPSNLLLHVQGVVTRDIEAPDSVYSLFGYRLSPFYVEVDRPMGPVSFAKSTNVQWLQACAFERGAMEIGLDEARLDMLKRLQAASIEKERNLRQKRTGDWTSWSLWGDGLGAT